MQQSYHRSMLQYSSFQPVQTGPKNLIRTSPASARGPPTLAKSLPVVHLKNISPPKKSYNINIWSNMYIYVVVYHYIAHQVEGSLATHASLFCSCTGQQALKPEFHRISNVLDQSWSNDCKSKWMIFAEHFTFGITIFAV